MDSNYLRHITVDSTETPTKKQHALTVLHRLLTDYTDRGSCGKRYWDTIRGLEEAIEILEEANAI